MKLGWIGTGNMGVRMAERLIKAGNDLNIYNRTPAKALRILDASEEPGAGCASLLDSPAAVAAESDIIFTSVTNAKAITDILEGEKGILSNARPGQILVEMSTLDPDFSDSVRDIVHGKGMLYLDAPVIGSMYMAEAGKLKIISSGDNAAYEAAKSFFGVIGGSESYMGEGARARFMKIAVNMMICTYLTIYGEILCAGEGLGYSWDELNDLLEHSEGAGPMLFDKGTTIRQRIWEGETALTSTAHKDLTLALACAEKEGFSIPLTALICQYDRLMHFNPRFKDYSTFGTIGALEQLTGITPPEVSSVPAGRKEELSRALVNTLTGATTVLASEAVTFCRKADIDISFALDCLSSCHGASDYFRSHCSDNKTDIHTIYSIQHDMRTVLENTRDAGLFLPIIAVARQKLNLYSYNEKLSVILE